MSDCRHGGRDIYAPKNRCEVRIFFTDPDEREFFIPIDLLDREISHVEIDGARYEKSTEEVDS